MSVLLQSISKYLEQAYTMTKPGTVVSALGLSELFCPFAQGVSRDGITIPSPALFMGNANARAAIDHVLFHDLSGINYWLKRLHEYPRRGGSSVSFMDWVLEQEDPFCTQYLLPVPEYTACPESFTIRMMNLFEVQQRFSIENVSGLAVYLYQLVTFGGLYLDSYFAKYCYQLSDVDSFIAGRCFQGELDRLLGGDASFSIFVPMTSRPDWDAEEALTNLESVETPEDLESCARNEAEQTVMFSYFTDEEALVVSALMESSWKEGSKAYMDYLRAPSNGFNKVGKQVFEHLMSPFLLSHSTTSFGVQNAPVTGMELYTVQDTSPGDQSTPHPVDYPYPISSFNGITGGAMARDVSGSNPSLVQNCWSIDDQFQSDMLRKSQTVSVSYSF